MKSHVEGRELVLEDGQRFNLDGDIDLRGTGITTLPDNLTVGESLDLCGTGVTALPDNLTVGDSLDLRGTGISTLPDGIKVSGEIIGFKPTQECNNDMGM